MYAKALALQAIEKDWTNAAALYLDESDPEERAALECLRHVRSKLTSKKRKLDKSIALNPTLRPA